MSRTEDFWTVLLRLAVSLQSDDEHQSHREQLAAIAERFRIAPQAAKNEMRRALLVVMASLEELSTSIRVPQ